MYNVLIIDDEEPLREAIRILGDWASLGVAEVYEATNGREGLEQLARQRIDLAIVDMKMPEMNGTELLQEIEREYPELLTIVISGYNDFEYTRQAIRSKVVDYLLKPVNRNDLNQALRKAVGVLEAKKQSENEFIRKNITLNMSLPKLKEKVYGSIIERSFKKHLNEAFLPLIGADDPGNRFGAVALRLLNFETVRERRFHQETELMYFSLANVLGEASEDGFACFAFASPKEEREMIAVYTIKAGYAVDEAFRSSQRLKKALYALHDLFGIVAVMGMGPLQGEVLELAASYDQARNVLAGVDLLKLRGPLLAEKAGALDSAVRDPGPLRGRIGLLRSALETGSLGQARAAVEEAARRWRTAPAFGLGDADWAVRELAGLLNDTALELGADGQSLPRGGREALKALGTAADYMDFDGFEAVLNALITNYSERVRQSASANRPFQIGDIKDYIDHHYFEDIKISMFTEKYYLSREYLMKLFKQQFGYGIHEYVQKLRMEKAQELLGDPALKIQDISDMLGYKDKNYFSKAFRNYYSVSPSEYRSGLDVQT
ncbi:response regulator [Paenibacillus sp. CN-4]|uniref:response regulator transcription factor n=1 Tax=Paenibacillus nanchangensis TaxID=3348343 RepID=UPI00397C9EDC